MLSSGFCEWVSVGDFSVSIRCMRIPKIFSKVHGLVIVRGVGFRRMYDVLNNILDIA